MNGGGCLTDFYHKALPPYLPSAGWYLTLFAEDEATERMKHANSTVIRGSHSDTLTLTVPVAGGREALRREADPMLSDHGRWRSIHISALHTAYGRMPFFEHYMPEIEAMIASSEGAFHTLCRDLHEAIGRMILIEEILPELTPETLRDPAIGDICSRVRGMADPALSILDLLFRTGPETIFGLIDPLKLSTPTITATIQ